MEVGAEAKKIKKSAEKWIVPLARFGYAAKGTVYSIIGFVAAYAAYRSNGMTTGSQGALETILRQPFGRILLGIVAFGLFGYAVWRLVQAVKDTENKGTGIKGIIRRIMYAGVGFVYFGLTFYAIRLIFDLSNGNGGGGDSKKEWTAAILSQAYGQFIIAAVGCGFTGYGIYQIYKAYSEKFREKLMTERMSKQVVKNVVRIARTG